jgi:hypothetical protein
MPSLQTAGRRQAEPLQNAVTRFRSQMRVPRRIALGGTIDNRHSPMGIVVDFDTVENLLRHTWLLVGQSFLEWGVPRA